MQFNKTLKTALLLSLFGLPLMQSCVSESDLQSAVRDAHDDGYDEGETVGYDRGFADGKIVGFNEGKAQGFQEGYNKGLSDGASLDVVTAYQTGFAHGENSGYHTGYDHGYDDGYNDGYDDGFEDGFDDGYDSGYNVGYNVGFNNGENYGYDIGYDDGYVDGDYFGYNEGYDHGFDDGYDIGYDDGWFDAGGFSSKLGSVNAATSLAASMMDKLINFKSIKAPKEVLADAKVQGQLAGLASAMSNDGVAQKAILEKYLVSSIQEQLAKSYGINQERSLAIARLANKMISTTSHRELAASETSAMAQEVLGSDLTAIESAVSASMKGDKTKMDAVVKKAADLNKISTKQAEAIMVKLVL